MTAGVVFIVSNIGRTSRTSTTKDCHTKIAVHVAADVIMKYMEQEFHTKAGKISPDNTSE